MPTETTEAEYEVGAWVGTYEDVADLFERLNRLVSEMIGGEGEGGPSITVDRENGDLKFDSVAEFREWGVAGKLGDAIEMRCFCSPRPVETKFRATLSVNRTWWRGGVRLRLTGTHSVAVSGIAEEMKKQIDRGKRQRIRDRTSHLVLLSLALVGAAGAFYFVDESIPAAVVLGVLWLAASVLNAFAGDIALRLVPHVEMLKSKDSPTIYQRWRARLLAGAGAVALVVVGAVLQAALAN